MTLQSKTPARFITANTALAAYLQLEGFTLEIDASKPNHCVFYFENRNPKLIEFVNKFESGQAEGNIVTFYFCYKRLLTRIKETLSGGY